MVAKKLATIIALSMATVLALNQSADSSKGYKSDTTKLYNQQVSKNKHFSQSGSTKSNIGELVGKNLANFLENDTNTTVNRGFTKYAYGAIAEGLMNECEINRKFATDCNQAIDLIVRKYISLAPANTNHLANLGHHGNYLSNLNLILGAHKKITGENKYQRLNSRITAHLLQVSSENKQHFPSYPGEHQLWPSDQSFVLYTAKLYDENYGTHFSEAPIKKWSEYVKQHKMHVLGLPVTSITAKTDSQETPRGSATAYLILYTSKINPALAKDWWQTFKKKFIFTKTLPFIGFKEYYDEKGKPDVDSGPIIFGMGATATVFGMGAASSMNENLLAHNLSMTIYAGRSASSFITDAKSSKLATDTLSDAVLFNMNSQRQYEYQ